MDVPIVAVASAPGCPDRAALVEALGEQIQTYRRVAAAEGEGGEVVLSVSEASEGRLHVRLVDARGAAVLERDVEVAGVSCGFRARTIAGIVERYLAGLPVPPDGMSAPPPLEVLVRPARVERVEVRAGPEGSIAIDGDGSTAGLAVGIAGRPLRRLVLSLDGFLFLGREARSGSGSISLAHDGLRAAAAWLFELRSVRLDLGVAVRVDRVEATTEDLATTGSVQHANVALGLRAVAIRKLLGLYAFAAVEPYRALAISRFAVFAGDVVRTPGWGLGLSLGVGYAFLRL